MSKTEWSKNSFFGEIGKVGSVLDVACGLSLKSKFLDADIRVGVDIYDEYFKHIESDVPYVVVKADVRNLEEMFVDKSFDVVIALDIIEHLPKHEAVELIHQCERIARKSVILETPLGFIPQDIDILGYGGHEWQTHRSGWFPTDLGDLGYKTQMRDYQMSDVQRHTEITTNPNITIIDAIKYV
jgi:SAM-dependent methyltransferase